MIMSKIRIDKDINGCWNCADALRNGYRCEHKDCYPCAQYKAFSVEFSEKNFPNILVSQLQVLNDMLKYKEYYGATYQIKDILEILIKIPVLGILVILNQSIENEVDILDNTRIRAFYQRILGKALALGDWEQLAQEISNIAKSKNDQEIKNYCSINESQDIKTDFSNISKKLKEYADQVEKNIFGEHQNIIKNSEILKQFIIKTKLLHELYQCYPSNNGTIRVSTWRNQNLGHGATKTNLQAVTDELRELLKFLKFILDRTQYLEFEFNEEAIDQNKMKFIAKYHNDVLDLAPYIYHILDEEEGALLFESFNSNNNKAHLLDYCDSTFHYNGDLSTKLASAWNMCKIKNIEPLSNNSIDADYISEEDNEALEALDTVDGKIINKVFYNIFNKFIASNNKGVLLLTAERGMGKTVFAKDISTTTYSYYNITKFAKDNNLIWSYLINDSYSCTNDMFAGQLIKVVENTLKVVRLRNDDYVQAKIKFEKSFSSNSNLNEKKESFCLFLVHSLRILKKRCQIEKFILVIDGLDEINYAQRNHLDAELFFDNVLPEDLYIVCLARNYSEVNNFGRNTYSGQYSFVEISRNDEIYRATLETYLKDKFGKYGKNKEYREKILALADNRLIYLETYKRIYDYNNINFINLISIEENKKEESLIALYLTALASDTGKKYVNELFRILVILSYIKEPITINELSILSHGADCNYRTFDIMGKLFDLRGFLQIQRSIYGNNIILANELWRYEVLNTFNNNDSKNDRHICFYLKNKLSETKNRILENLYERTNILLKESNSCSDLLNIRAVDMRGNFESLKASLIYGSNTSYLKDLYPINLLLLKYFIKIDNNEVTKHDEYLMNIYCIFGEVDDIYDSLTDLLDSTFIDRLRNDSKSRKVPEKRIKEIIKEVDNFRPIVTEIMMKMIERSISTVEFLIEKLDDNILKKKLYSDIYQKMSLKFMDLKIKVGDIKNTDKELKSLIEKISVNRGEAYDAIKENLNNKIQNNKYEEAMKYINTQLEYMDGKNLDFTNLSMDEFTFAVREELFRAYLLKIQAENYSKLKDFQNSQLYMLDSLKTYKIVFEMLDSINLTESFIEDYIYFFVTYMDAILIYDKKEYEKTIKESRIIIAMADKIFFECKEMQEGLNEVAKIEILKRINLIIFIYLFSHINQNKVKERDKNIENTIKKFLDLTLKLKNTLGSEFSANILAIISENFYMFKNKKEKFDNMLFEGLKLLKKTIFFYRKILNEKDEKSCLYFTNILSVYMGLEIDFIKSQTDVSEIKTAYMEDIHTIIYKWTEKLAQSTLVKKCNFVVGSILINLGFEEFLVKRKLYSLVLVSKGIVLISEADINEKNRTDINSLINYGGEIYIVIVATYLSGLMIKENNIFKKINIAYNKFNEIETLKKMEIQEILFAETIVDKIELNINPSIANIYNKSKYMFKLMEWLYKYQ